MASQPVHPLRIQKDTPSSSPVKMGGSIPRALTELGPTEKRRNSPSYIQMTKKMTLNKDSSPIQSSPFYNTDASSSPRHFWQGREPVTPNRFSTENNQFGLRNGSPSPTRRSSIEKLERASRVKNSNMFAREQKQEYDPTSIPVIERPLAKPIQGNAYGGSGLDGSRTEDRGRMHGHKRSESKTGIPLYSPTKTANVAAVTTNTPLSFTAKEQTSPFKSSLATARYNANTPFDPENGTWSEENSGDERELPPGRALHRHAKSVTFDAAPPQVNEYEMATPDISSVGTVSRENSYDSDDDYDEVGYTYNREDSEDREDSFDASLEDADKTPVVGPEHWNHGSLATSNNEQSRLEDPFRGPESVPFTDVRSSDAEHASPAENDSPTSSSDHRPLPPLPGGLGMNDRKSLATSPPQSTTAERLSNAQRNLPSLPAASTVSKLDIQSMGGKSMTLEERLQLMMLQDKPKSAAEEQRERRMRRAGVRTSQTPETDTKEIKIHEDADEEADTFEDIPTSREFQLPPRISRESILRKVNGLNDFENSEYGYSSPAPSSSPERALPHDPDVPLPSTENQSIIDNDDAEDSVVIKAEAEEDFDVYSIPDMYQGAESKQTEADESYAHGEDDSGSQYSDPTPSNRTPEVQLGEAQKDGEQYTPRASTPSIDFVPVDSTKVGERMSLPELKGFLDGNDFGLSFQSYMSPPAVVDENTAITVEAEQYETQAFAQRPKTPEEQSSKIASVPKPEYDGSGWGPDDEYDDETPDSPGSVIRHPMPPSPSRDSPSIPEQVATIKSSSGSKLKTRPSATPADLIAMREARRQVSGESQNVPPIPDRHRNRPSLSLDRNSTEVTSDPENEDSVARKTSFKKKSLTLDIGNDDGLGLDKDFDRVIEAQKVAFNLSSDFETGTTTDAKQVLATGLGQNLGIHANFTPRKQRGYLMRQNTKLVVASSDNDRAGDDARGTRSAGNSPLKKDRPQSWTVEPWNGKTRRKSARDVSNGRKKYMSGPVPPMPGHESNVAGAAGNGLGTLNEEEAVAENIAEESEERGRLFVKVLGVKDLDLPLPKSERTWFSLTLDNGIHCVTTAWLELGRNAPIGQEFELMVHQELEFQLTLNVKLEQPAPRHVPESPTKASKPQKVSTFSRVFASPKKRKEMEMKMKEEEQRAVQVRQKEAQAKRLSSQPTAWDLLSPLAADDGSFGRSYVCLKDHESRCFGRPYVVDIPCFNEWATEEATALSSARSKRGNTHLVRRAPYKVGKLELQLLYVPKPRGSSVDDMPKSMNACIREMKAAETAQASTYEGHLSQQGGDCPYWRRRFFKLEGSRLTAYHEATRQPRATINLANAGKLIDDRRALTQRETTGRGGSRRKSGFAEEEEGYMFVDEGFRVRFRNGEVIDFYADSAADKDGWMKVLDKCVGRDGAGAGGGALKWCDLVLKKEASLKRKQAVVGQMMAPQQQQQQQHQQKHQQHPQQYHRQAAAAAADRSLRHQKTRSMIM